MDNKRCLPNTYTKKFLHMVVSHVTECNSTSAKEATSISKNETATPGGGGWGARLLFVFFNSFKGFWPPKVIIGLSIFIGGFWKDDISR
jgi:hypothetical protein